MTYLTVPRLGMTNRLKESIPIFMNESTALSRLKEGIIKLMPGVEYPHYIKKAAELSSR